MACPGEIELKRLKAEIRLMYVRDWLESTPPFQNRDIRSMLIDFNKKYPGIINNPMQFSRYLSKIDGVVGYDIFVVKNVDLSNHFYSWKMPLLSNQNQQTKLPPPPAE